MDLCGSLGARRSPPEGQKGPAGGPNPGPEARARALVRPGPGPGPGAEGLGPGRGAHSRGPGAEGQGSGRARWSKAWPTLARLRELGEPGPRNPARARVGAQTTGAC